MIRPLTLTILLLLSSSALAQTVVTDQIAAPVQPGMGGRPVAVSTVFVPTTPP
jgi:hypothetical protein